MSSATPGQTVGPFFGYALPYPDGELLVAPDRPGRIVVHGRVLDGAGDPVPDALIELWQADAEFTGFGRCPTDADGRYAFTTVAPQVPFFALTVFARGLLDRLFTRAYLAEDPFLETVPAARRATLRATPDAAGFTFDIWLQGENETVFLRFPRHG